MFRAIIFIASLILLISCTATMDEFERLGKDPGGDGDSDGDTDGDTDGDSDGDSDPGSLGDECGDSLPECMSGLHCENGVCCNEGDVCCTEESHCSDVGDDGNHSCNTSAFACYGDCWDPSEQDSWCAEGYHCENLTGCEEDLVTGACDETSDCISGECISNHCCEHAGICCETDADCSEWYYACDNAGPEFYMTCAFVAFPLPDTGLGDEANDCYNAANDRVACSGFSSGEQYFGQDGHYDIASQAFTFESTGLYQDDTTGLIWNQDISSSMVDWTAASGECTGGLGLPTRHELQSIVDYGVDSGWYLPSELNGSTGPGLFWTQTTVADGTDTYAWAIDFQTGTVEHINKSSGTAYVRCVQH